IYQTDIGIKDNRFSVIAPYRNGKPVFYIEGLEEIEAYGKYIMPGIVDAHVHIESTMVTEDMFANEVIRHGTTTAVVDHHEIPNVLGDEVVTYMAAVRQDLTVHILTMTP